VLIRNGVQAAKRNRHSDALASSAVRRPHADTFTEAVGRAPCTGIGEGTGQRHPGSVYTVVGLKRDAEEAATAHLQLKLDADRMSDDERKSRGVPVSQRFWG
jgi:hypothetical protein